MASIQYKPLITNAGRAAIVNANINGFSIEITHVGFDRAAFIPSGIETQPKDEIVRVPLAASIRTNEYTLQVLAEAVAPPGQADWVGAVNFYAGDVLFAVLSQQEGLNIYLSDEGLSTINLSISIVPVQASIGNVEVVVDVNASASLALIQKYIKEVKELKALLVGVHPIPANKQLEVNKRYILDAGVTGVRMPETFEDGDFIAFVHRGDMVNNPAQIIFSHPVQSLPAGTHSYNENTHRRFDAYQGRWL